MTRPHTRRAALGVAAALSAAALAPVGAVRANTPNVYAEYHVTMPNGDSGEPSIGFDPNAGAAMYGSGLNVERLTWNDSVAGAPMTSADVTPVQNSLTTLDSITIVDQHTHRTFQADLAAAGSVMTFNDAAGAGTWTPSNGFAPGVLLDHESIGGGPFHTPIPSGTNPLYPDAVYYCAQNSFSGTCAVSLDGGLTFQTGVPAYNSPANDTGDPNPTFAAEGGACSALHGHLRVGPDGTAYLPLKGCGGSATTCNLTNTEYAGGTPSLSVSPDNGTTWTVRMVPGGHNTDESDPSVDVAPNGNAYFGWEDGTNPDCVTSALTTSARIAKYDPTTQTFSTPVDVSSGLGIKNVMFPEVIAGDNNRAAFSFLGTSATGDDQQNGFVGEWHLYVAMTYDGGATWTTQDATPTDPVQRGCIDNQGIAPGSPKNNVCAHRNLLDFNDITVDKQGRVLVAYTKGCTGACVTDATSTVADNQDYVLRQLSGVGLYAAYDGTLVTPPVNVPVAPLTILLPLAGAAILGGAGVRRRRRMGRTVA